MATAAECPKWKRATIAIVVVLMVLIIVTVCVSVSVLHESVVLRRAAQVAVGKAARTPARPTTPPPEDDTTLPPPPMPHNSPTHPFNRFASDLIMRLEKSQGRTSPSPPPSLTSQGTLSSQFGKSNAWILEGEGQLWVVFRGTATKDEWEKDFELKQAPLLSRALSTRARKIVYPVVATAPQTHAGPQLPEDVMVHSGFLQIYNDLAETIHEAVTHTKHTNVCVAGHSLGGALAQLTALDVCTAHPDKVVDVVVFGCPRVGNTRFAEEVIAPPNLNTFTMFANTCDVVPNIPLAVQPTLKTPDTPMLYTHPTPTQAHNFTVNKGSWVANHSMDVYANRCGVLAPDFQ